MAFSIDRILGTTHAAGASGARQNPGHMTPPWATAPAPDGTSTLTPTQVSWSQLGAPMILRPQQQPTTGNGGVHEIYISLAMLDGTS